jgi:hypothetical protein
MCVVFVNVFCDRWGFVCVLFGVVWQLEFCVFCLFVCCVTPSVLCVHYLTDRNLCVLIGYLTTCFWSCVTAGGLCVIFV